jgi:hypothetical protein
MSDNGGNMRERMLELSKTHGLRGWSLEWQVSKSEDPDIPGGLASHPLKSAIITLTLTRFADADYADEARPLVNDLMRICSPLDIKPYGNVFSDGPQAWEIKLYVNDVSDLLDIFDQLQSLGQIAG